MMRCLQWRGDSLAYEQKMGIVKNAIKSIAAKKGYSRFQQYRVTDNDIWNWILDKKHDKYFKEREIPKYRKMLPKQYNYKPWKK